MRFKKVEDNKPPRWDKYRAELGGASSGGASAGSAADQPPQQPSDGAAPQSTDSSSGGFWGRITGSTPKPQEPGRKQEPARGLVLPWAWQRSGSQAQPAPVSGAAPRWAAVVFLPTALWCLTW